MTPVFSHHMSASRPPRGVAAAFSTAGTSGQYRTRGRSGRADSGRPARRRHLLDAAQYSQVLSQNGDSFAGAPCAVLDWRQQNLYALGGQADGVTIRSFTIRNFGSPGDINTEGVVNHDSLQPEAGQSIRARSRTTRVPG